jgi:hypothetical protein
MVKVKARGGKPLTRQNQRSVHRLVAMEGTPSLVCFLTIDIPSLDAVNLATLPDLVLHNIFEHLDSKQDIVCISYTSKRLHHIANRFLYRFLFNYAERKELLRRGLCANPANIQYIRCYESYDPESLQEIWSVASTRLQELSVVWPPECSLSSIVQCLVARHAEFTLQDLKLYNVQSWDYLLLSFTLSFTNIVSVHLSFEELQDPPTAQTVVDILNSLSLKSLRMVRLSDWRLDLDEKLPKLEYLQIYADESPEDFDGDCWRQLSALMNRAIRYDCNFGDSFTDLYEDVFAYAELENLDPTPLVHWLAVGQMSPEDDPLVSFAGLSTPHLLRALSSIADIQDLRLRIPLHPDCVHEVFRLITKSAKCLIFTSVFQISSSLFLEFFRSLSKIEELRIFVSVFEDSDIIWPAGYFTNASASFSIYANRRHYPLSVRAIYERDHLPRWISHNESWVMGSFESFEADFTNLNEEIMGWFRMKESLRQVEILCTKIF